MCLSLHFSEDLLASSFLTYGISNNSDGREDVLIRGSAPRELAVEEDECDVEDLFQVLDEDDDDGVDPFGDPED